VPRPSNKNKLSTQEEINPDSNSPSENFGIFQNHARVFVFNSRTNLFTPDIPDQDLKAILI